MQELWFQRMNVENYINLLVPVSGDYSSSVERNSLQNLIFWCVFRRKSSLHDIYSRDAYKISKALWNQIYVLEHCNHEIKRRFFKIVITRC